MRIDKALSTDDLTINQAFFKGCWFNMSHEMSLDSDRASFVHPINGAHELLSLYDFGDNFGGPSKRVTVSLEFQEVIKTDLVLKGSKYALITEKLVSLLSIEKNNPSNTEQCAINKQSDLVIILLKEFIYLTETYLEDAFSLLEAQLSVEINDDNKNSVFTDILSLTNSIVGGLISSGVGLNEISSFYRHILCLNMEDNTFSQRYEHLKAAATKVPEDFEITFQVESTDLASILNNIDDSFTFGLFTLSKKAEGLLTAKCIVRAQSYTTAGTKAYELLGEVIDAVSYTQAKSSIIVRKKYVAKSIQSQRGKTFTIHRAIPNPVYRFNEDSFRHFCESIQSTSQQEISSFKHNKIAAAFRLLRIGTGALSLEAKLTSYWTALESLTRDVFPSHNGDDGKVIAAAIPSISINYVSKRLKSFVYAFNHIGLTEFQVDEDTAFSLQGADIIDMYKALRDTNKANHIIAKLVDYPFFQFKVHSFSQCCQSSVKMGARIESHEQKVKLQLHRIYRARNAIAHDAGKVDNLELLCSNLEHYLTSNLNSMIGLMSIKPTLESPKECFIQYADMVRDIKLSLNPALKKKADKRAGEEQKLLNENYHNDEKLLVLLNLNKT
ncbi:hypothetical protein [Pseudoalteromonas rubra]|uniref:Apea-like HEPN domain-containing protein n=1 Tax=Pseudoalteromonas rubra TaxID=43658 RepID=A0A5S3X2U3_9GAMM|nr:hypothetical protein [Pseudoalteromonas rubra]TMP38278.1 hypothetical protein CWB98_07270 [Pseudoalteromonas rubra]